MGEKHERKKEERRAFWRFEKYRAHSLEEIGRFLAKVEWARTTYAQRDYLSESLVRDGVCETVQLEELRNYRGCVWSDKWLWAQPVIMRRVWSGISSRFIYYVGEDVEAIQAAAVSEYAGAVTAWAEQRGIHGFGKVPAITADNRFPHHGDGSPKRYGAETAQRRPGLIGVLVGAHYKLLERSAATAPPKMYQRWNGNPYKNPYVAGWRLSIEQWADTSKKARTSICESLAPIDLDKAVSFSRSLRDKGYCLWTTRPWVNSSEGIRIIMERDGQSFVWIARNPEHISIIQEYAEKRYAELLVDWAEWAVVGGKDMKCDKQL